MGSGYEQIVTTYRPHAGRGRGRSFGRSRWHSRTRGNGNRTVRAKAPTRPVRPQIPQNPNAGRNPVPAPKRALPKPDWNPGSGGWKPGDGWDMVVGALQMLNLLVNGQYTPDRDPNTSSAAGTDPGNGAGSDRDDAAADCRRGGQGWMDYQNTDAGLPRLREEFQRHGVGIATDGTCRVTVLPLSRADACLAPGRPVPRLAPVGSAARLGARTVARYTPAMQSRRAYPSDLSDARWAVIEPVLSAWRVERRSRALPFTRLPAHDLREILNAILYVDRTGVQWRYLPHDFPP